jgi:hypothetical protein
LPVDARYVSVALRILAPWGTFASMTTPRKKPPKTQPEATPVAAFLATLPAATRADCEQLCAWMGAATASEGTMYGKAIVGFGSSTIRYADGREEPWMKLGFSPRKAALVLYGVLPGASPQLLEQLGRHELGKGCLYVKRLAGVDARALQQIIEAAGATK